MTQETCPWCGRPIDETTATSATEDVPMRSGEDAARSQAQLMRYARELAAAAPYLPHELRKRISDGETSCKRCQVAVLFADLVDFTRHTYSWDAEDVFRLLNDYFRRLGRVVHEHGGMVGTFLGDGIMAVFGLSGPNDQDAAQAVRAALSMGAEMQQMSPETYPGLSAHMQLHIGISYGEAIVGTVGAGANVDRWRLSYTAVGKTVSLAHRLQEEAPAGVILVSQSVHQATHEMFNYHYFDALTIKGFDEPVPAFVVRSWQKPRG